VAASLGIQRGTLLRLLWRHSAPGHAGRALREDRGRLSWVHDHSVAALSGLKTGWFAGRLDLSRYDPPPVSSEGQR
jgi:hypothetical protein